MPWAQEGTDLEGGRAGERPPPRVSDSVLEEEERKQGGREDGVAGGGWKGRGVVGGEDRLCITLEVRSCLFPCGTKDPHSPLLAGASGLWARGYWGFFLLVSYLPLPLP